MGELSGNIVQGMLAEARAEVGIADHKASMVLAALGIGFGAILGGVIAGDWDPTSLVGVGEGFWWAGATVAVLSIACAAAAVWPRYDKSDLSSGIYYWGHVASFKTLVAFKEAFKNSPPNEALRTEHQLWRLSRIVNKKYFFVRCAFVLAAGAVVLFAVGVGVGTPNG